MVKVRIKLLPYLAPVVVIQRAKYKHWFYFGEHKATDNAFKEATKKNELDIKFILPKELL